LLYASFFRGLRSELGWRREERDLEAELADHLARAENDNLARGLTPSEARRQARLALGGEDSARELQRDARGLPWLSALRQDVAYAARGMRRNPGFALLVVLTLVLGMGASTAIFSVANAVLLRPLPYNNPSQLVGFSYLRHGGATARLYPYVSLNQVEAWRRESRTLDSVGSFVFSALPVRVANQSISVTTVFADPELLTTLGVAPEVGSNLSGTGSTRKDSSAVITHRLWMEAFHGDSQAVGRTLLADGESYTVVGILPARFEFPRRDASFFPEQPDLLLPVANIADLWGRQYPQWVAVGRLKPGVGLRQAQADMDGLTARLSAHDPALKGISVRLNGLQADTTRKARPALLIVLGISVLLLLIACSNVMNLLLARSAARTREMLVRTALGATPARLVRQLLTESACLTLVAGGLGMLFAGLGNRALLRLWPSFLPVTGHVGLDWRVLAFALALSLASALATGVVPAWQCRRARERQPGERATSGRSFARLQRGLMVAQVALGVALLAGAGLLANSLIRLNSVDPEFRSAGVLGFEFLMPTQRAHSPAELQQRNDRIVGLNETILEQVKAIPGVVSAGLVTNLPPETRAGMFMGFSIVGQPTSSPQSCNFQIASEDYFPTLAVPVVEGRNFTPRDNSEARPVVMVNQAFVREFLRRGDALDRQLTASFNPGAPRQVVGVVRDMHDRGLGAKAIPTVYVPFRQFAQAYGAVVLRTNLPPDTVFPAVRARLQRSAPIVALDHFTSIHDRIDRTLDEPRFYTAMAATCALMALLFVTLGLYGVVTFSVARRTAEIGIRTALGATMGSILRGVLWQGVGMALAGAAIGLVLALSAGQVLAQLLFAIKPNDPATLAGAATLVILVTLGASYVPARRAARVDPLTALRHE